MRIVRTSLLTRSIAALLAVLVCGSALNWGHAGGDDRDFDIVVVHHDHTAHRFSTAPTTPSPSDHCYLCHSLRLFHYVLTSRSERPTTTLRAVRRLVSEHVAVRDGLHVGLSSRAPPTIHL
jgi:hypothetical protein